MIVLPGTRSASPAHWRRPRSDVKGKVCLVALPDDGVLAFKAPLASFLRAVVAALVDEVLLIGELGVDGAFLQVGAAHINCFLRGRAVLHGARRAGYSRDGCVGSDLVRRCPATPIHRVETRRHPPNICCRSLRLGYRNLLPSGSVHRVN